MSFDLKSTGSFYCSNAQHIEVDSTQTITPLTKENFEALEKMMTEKAIAHQNNNCS